MKTLCIIRHAKSSWNFRQLDDFSRPLGDRGREDVIRMGKHLQKESIERPQMMVSSPASRAFYTTLHLADAWNYPEAAIRLEPALYHADADETIEVLQEYDDYDYLSITGHNPGFTELINVLAKRSLDNLPTCGMYWIEFDVDYWEEIGSNHAVNERFVFPKGI